MKKFLSIILLASAATLVGCGKTVNPDGTVTTTQPSLDDIIAGVQKYAHLTCGAAPTGQVIANIIGTVVPEAAIVITAATVGSAICAAYNAASEPTKMARRGLVRAKMVNGFRVTPGAVNGVPIR
jgi:hypothetical protein